MMNWGRWQTLNALGLEPSLKPEDWPILFPGKRTAMEEKGKEDETN